MKRYVDPLLFGLATLVVQVGGTAILSWTQAEVGLYPSVVKWAAMAILGFVAGWRASTLGLVAIVLVNAVVYGLAAVISSDPTDASLDAVRATLLFAGIAGASYLVGSYLHRRQAAT